MRTPIWLESVIADPQVTDLCLNGPRALYVDRGQGLESLVTSEWTDDELRDWVLHQLSQVGKTWDAKHPFVDAVFWGTHRAHLAFPPLTSHGILLSLRRLPTPSDPSALSKQRWCSSALFDELVRAIQNRASILICGATGSGKTTLLGDLLQQVPLSERILALEDTPELHPTHPHFVSLTSRPANADGYGQVTLRDLLRQTLRMRPDRIILGECRGAEVLDLLQALNTGHGGTLATIHANSARDGLKRLELLCLLACNGQIPVGVIRDLVVGGLHYLAFVKRQGRERAISELWKIEGKEGDTILLRPCLVPFRDAL